ncbi:hypothetical protein SAMN05421676_11038 [Salinibacillus kushneri]|uniref:DUF309 domain-containing protein n=1 Tax=Salinibacillus kushneri TaxID=237682 RepID=A0A1I0HXM9_9BACI|nr:DUF309 domain-containing protein [Salinibacillus kushneri]SET88930.1 hypothetical protein SAMN05421676_11038 [Salinibacillus kushneri]
MYDDAYITYLAHFLGTRDYFECHEILEDRWKMEKPLDRDSIWVAFIQLAVSLYHQRRGNDVGALRLIQKSKQKFYLHHMMIAKFGLNKKELLQTLNLLEENIVNKKPYQSISLPFQDPHLIDLVKRKCGEWNCTFNSKSDLSNPYIVHKHILRHSL